MGDLSRNFSRREFACKCGCGFDTVDVELLAVLEDLHDTFDGPVKINSGCRCREHNKREGGSPDSEHLTGKAADVVVDGVPAHVVHAYLISSYPGRYGIGKYHNRTHIDVRLRTARWEK